MQIAITIAFLAFLPFLFMFPNCTLPEHELAGPYRYVTDVGTKNGLLLSFAFTLQECRQVVRDHETANNPGFAILGNITGQYCRDSGNAEEVCEREAFERKEKLAKSRVDDLETCLNQIDHDKYTFRLSSLAKDPKCRLSKTQSRVLGRLWGSLMKLRVILQESREQLASLTERKESTSLTDQDESESLTDQDESASQTNQDESASETNQDKSASQTNQDESTSQINQDKSASQTVLKHVFKEVKKDFTSKNQVTWMHVLSYTNQDESESQRDQDESTSQTDQDESESLPEQKASESQTEQEKSASLTTVWEARTIITAFPLPTL